MAASPELSIRAQRAAFNQALAKADLPAIGPLLSLQAVMITGSDSSVISGRKAQLLAWKREFSAADRIIYTRIPDRITCSAIEPIAMEFGQWQGQYSQSKAIMASGDYSAKWRNIGGQWQIIAEIFLTLA